MTRAKSKGGLGFRDLHSFNLALLVKQGWRIIHEPLSLLARSLKAKYFPQCSFFEANLGSRPSFIWRSILAGRDVLCKGGIWRVGDGRNIRVAEDVWVPEVVFNEERRHRLVDFRIAWVSQLIVSSTGQWDVDLIRSVFDSNSSKAILQVPILRRGNDLFAWKGTKNGIFSVRSAYYVARKALAEGGDARLFCAAPVFWTDVWKLDVMPKIKVFLWRLGHQSLPTMDNLLKRGMSVSNFCPVCGSELENAAHLFMSCKWVLRLWSSFFKNIDPRCFANENLFDWYDRNHGLLDRRNWLIFNILLWLI